MATFRSWKQYFYLQAHKKAVFREFGEGGEATGLDLRTLPQYAGKNQKRRDKWARNKLRKATREGLRKKIRTIIKAARKARRAKHGA